MSIRTIAIGAVAAILVASLWFAIDTTAHMFRSGRLHMIATCVCVGLFGASWLLDGDGKTKWEQRSKAGRGRGRK